MNRAILIFSAILASWLGMQAVHELGHVLGAWLTEGQVARVVLHPLTISRTDLSNNPNPLMVVWAGPIFGVVCPLLFWLAAAVLHVPGTFLPRFFAGFCLVANGAYIAAGSFDRIGDCKQMLQHDSPIWTLWLFGLICVPAGLALWHNQSSHFGWGPKRQPVQPAVAYSTLAIGLLLLVLGFVVDGQ
jgi:hypothetical protein